MAKAKTKKPRTAAQLANDERLRNRKKTNGVVDAPVAPATAPPLPPEDDEFEPTDVKEAKAAQPELVAPTPSEDAEQIEAVEDPVVSPQLPVQPAVDPNLVASIVAAVMEVQRQNPQVATATPEQKIAELESIEPKKRHKARISADGAVQGIVFKYEVDKGYYPDPTQRLLSEPKLARFAMHENFIFKWEVDGVEYKKDNITFSEPRFTLELFRRLYDEEGAPTGKAALVARQMQHEDEFTTRIAAQKLGILRDYEESEEGFAQLMSEIRYWRLQQWLFAIFTPPKIQTFRRRATRQVIDGKQVEVYDTEQLTDHDTGVSQASTLQSQSGIGSIAVPE